MKIKVPELSKEHKLAIFILVLVIIIILFFLSTPTSREAEVPTPARAPVKPVPEKKAVSPEPAPLEKPQETKQKKQEDVKTESTEIKKAQALIAADPDMVSMEQLFAPYRKNNGAVPEKAGIPMPVKQFAAMIIKDIDSFSTEDFKIIEKALLNAGNVNIGTIGLEFIKAKNEKLQVLGYELITKSCVDKPAFFLPNEFYMAFASKGFAAEPFITEIIESTKDDFCREWACELYVDIFYHNSDDNDGRHRKLEENKQMEKEIYQRIEKLFDSEERVKKIIESKQRIGAQIREMWGKDKRCSMKMLEVMKLIDNLNEKNQYATRVQLLKVISTYNFNYNILNHVDGKPVDLPPVPGQIKLKYLANAVFKGGTTNTFKWLHKKDGGFTLEEVKTAVNNNDRERISQMNRVLQKIICAVLRGKLLLGLGHQELELLRYFRFASWDNKPFQWDDNMIIIQNMSGGGAPLMLSQEPDPKKILTGKGLGKEVTEEKHQSFYIPSQSVFVWFAGDGDYILSVNPKNTAVKPEQLLNFDRKRFNLNQNNMTLEIF